MTQNINLSNYLNSLTGNTAKTQVEGQGQMTNSSVPVSDVKTAVEIIKNMLPGDIFTGSIEQLSGNEVSIRMGNGKLLNASLLMDSNNIRFAKGDMVTFLVDSKSDSSVSLKSLDSNEQEVIFANKALEASNLAMNKSNLEMVKGLVDLNMPIDKKTLTEVSKLLTKFPDAPLDTVLRLYKLEMPVTQDNIVQFEAYKSYEHDMTGTIKNLTEDFNNLINNLISGNEDGKAVDIARDFVELLTNTGVNNTEVLSENANLTEQMKDEVKNILAQFIPERTEEGSTKDTAVVEKSLKEVLEFIKNPEKPQDMKNELINQLLKNTDIPKEHLSKLITSSEFKDIFNELLKDNMFIKPKDVSEKGEVKDFYKKLLTTVSEGQKILEKAGIQNTDMAKGMTSVKNNVQFMNDLNHQMAFMQIPIKFQESETKGDLYVYTNKKALTGKNDNLTALLHLDMEHLGPMDIYVKLSGSNVSTNFCLESEELLDFIYAHIDLLTKRLNDKGYNFTPTMTVKDNEGNVDFVKDFLDVASPVVPVGRYMFDTKA
ncbi:MAG: flagellar hook-length control protein FliK [Lachnospiraceae bacterium]